MFFKKIIFLATLVFAIANIFSFLVLPVKAQGIAGEIGKQLNAAAGDKGAGLGTLGTQQDPRTIVAKIIKVALSLLGMIFFVLALYAGYLWMTAGGNEEQVTKAKTLLFQATIGVGIIFAAYSITSFAIKLALGQGQDYSNGVWIEPPKPVTNPAPY